MLIKKDESKMRAILNKIKFYSFPIFFLFFFTSHLMLIGQNGRGWSGNIFLHEYTWKEYFQHIYIPIIISLTPPFLYFISNFFKYKKEYLKYDIVSGICDNCGKCMNDVLEHTRCTCGGEVISYKHLVWIEDSKDKMK